MTAATIDELLAMRAQRSPDAPFLRFRTGDLSFAAVDADAEAFARGLASIGVARGDLVPLLMSNSEEMCLSWFALTKLGAVEAPVNTAFRGAGLAHVLNLTEASVIVADEGLCEPLEKIAGELGSVHTLVVRGDPDAVAGGFSRWRVMALDELREVSDGQLPARPVRERDPAMVLFTSGTTGRSKGCLLSHHYAVRHAELMSEQLRLRQHDVLYTPFPLFHVDASVFTVMPALVLGATAALGERFSTSGFWDEVRAVGATVFDFMGATLSMLHRREPRPDDADNPVRLAWGVPLPDFAGDFEQRFDLRLTEVYGLTDAGIVIYSPLDQPRRAGSCGKAIEPFDVRVLDEHDREVPDGELGEIAVRSNEPGSLMDGYLGMPDETRAAFRNGWFHTGDRARRDADGYFYFAGRGKDVIRRRGENISALEVEEAVLAHGDVVEAAAYGVPSELTEEDVMVAVVMRPGAEVDPEELVRFCERRMARHMVPRYVELMDALPRTPTEKLEKARLIERGVGPATWDREESKAVNA
jgi:carnitine-CoA ligase